MPEFLRMVLEALRTSGSESEGDLVELICRYMEAAVSDLSLMEAVQLLDGGQLLDDSGKARCFHRFICLAKERSAAPLARSAALDGAFRFALSNRIRQLQLLQLLLELDLTEEPLFLARAAKITGLAYSHWTENELVHTLRILSGIPGVYDEAAFELGMARLADGLNANTRTEADQALTDAMYWLSRSDKLREYRLDARLFIACLQVLVGFSQGNSKSSLTESVSAINEAASLLRAWHCDEADPPWLGAKLTHAACWRLLALRLSGLIAQLEEPSWWEPALVIGEFVLACYSASRSILCRDANGGIESLIRPRIESTLSMREGQAHALKVWSQKNPYHVDIAAARSLLSGIDLLIGKVPNGTDRVANPWLELEQLIDSSGISSDGKTDAKRAIADALIFHLGSISASEIAAMEKCFEGVQQHPDYRDNPSGRLLFNAVVVWTIRFLHCRLEMTRKDDPGVSYLFERPGPLPLERELQADYHRFMYAAAAGSEIEISNIGGGRADVRFSYGGERLVVEVKREGVDCSFENLAQLYSGQAADYQNVSIRLGVLLVLDQSRKGADGTPHISSLISSAEVLRGDETTPRHLVMVKVPGRRLLPSALSGKV